ncbi:histidine kinase, partial [Actinotalea sp. C106]|uniref:histidine kinase n=1 Tax=Actinotalea sp. C106 TaxID=2908644 RepID=UPI0020296F24
MDGPVGWWRREARGTARRRVVSDAAVTFLVGVALLWLGMVGVWTSGPGPVESAWVHLAPLAVGCLVMLAKNRHPLGALAAGGLVLVVDAALGGSVGVLLVLIDLIYSAALRTGPAAFRRLTVGVGLTVGAAAVAGLVAERTVAGAVLFALQAFAVLGTPLWWGLTVRKQAELTALAEERAADLERLAELREREVLAEERTRMARDLHDAVAGNLSAIAIHAEAALAATPTTSDSKASPRPSLEAIRAASVQSLHEMRSMIMLLRAAGPPGAPGTLDAARAPEQAAPDDATSP